MEKLRKGRRGFLRVIGILGGASLLLGVHLPLVFGAEIYPTDKITYIVPVKAGGGFDLIARGMGIYLPKYFKEVSKGAKGGDIVIKNVAEAGGARAYNNVFYARPDGYTIGDFNTAFVTDNITEKIEFDVSKYTFLVRIGASERYIVVRKDGFKSWEEMVKAGKEKEVKWAASNFGRGYHVASILLKEAAKLPVRLINFPGAAENVNALLRGDVQVAMLTEESAKPMLDAGEIRVIMVMSEKSEFPGVPTVGQLGFPELAESTKLQRFVIGPPNIPKERTQILISCFKKVFSDKEFLAHAKRLNFPANPIYGEDAERLAKSLFKYYDEKTPVLKKYLQ
ncbi:MAG: Bug family tripartite tricarboxylate transporter substrate binding protein [Thermodesulfobacteriota bacterium]